MPCTHTLDAIDRLASKPKICRHNEAAMPALGVEWNAWTMGCWVKLGAARVQSCGPSALAGLSMRTNNLAVRLPKHDRHASAEVERAKHFSIVHR